MELLKKMSVKKSAILVARLTNSAKETLMEEYLSKVFSYLTQLHNFILDMSVLFRKHDKKVIEIQHKCEITRVLIREHEMSLKKF